MFEVRYPIQHAPRLAQFFSEQFQVSHHQDLIRRHYQHPQLEGEVITAQINEDLSIMISNFVPKAPLRVTRDGTVNPDLVAIDFQVKGEAFFKLTSEVKTPQDYSMLLPGAYIAAAPVISYADFEPYQHQLEVHIFVTRQWLQETFFIETPHGYLQQYLSD